MTRARTPTPSGDRMAQIVFRAEQKLRERAVIVIQRAWRAWRFGRAVRSWLDSKLEQVQIKEETPDTEVEMVPVQDSMDAEPEIEEAAVQPVTEGQAEVETRHPAGIEMTNDESHQNSSPTYSAPPRSAKEQFYIDIQRYYEDSELPLKKWLTVGNKTLELWDLWKAVTDQDEESGYQDWELIAEVLNFDWLDNPNVTNQLKVAFDEHLKGFEEALKSFEEEMAAWGGEKGEDGEGGSQQRPAQIPELFESSPPVPATKRRREHLVSSPILGVSPPSKRLRYDPDQEIPETPEKPEQASQTTPRAGHTVEPMSLRTKRQHDLAQSASTKVIPEPETQDFSFRQHPGHGDAEPDLLELQHGEPLLSDDSDSEFPPLKQLIQNPTKFKNQKPSPGSESSSDAFGTPMESPPTRPTRTAPAADPTLARPQLASSAAPNPTPRPLLTNRLAPIIYFSPPRRPPSGMSRPPRATRPPVPEPNPFPPQPSRVGTTRRQSGQAAPLAFFSSSPPQPKQSPEPGPESLAALTPTEFEARIREYVVAGYRRADVMTALQATNMVVDEAELVMESLATRQGIPGNTPGVWTKKDDDDMASVMTMDQLRALGGGTSQLQRVADEKLERLVKKHGAGNVEERRKFVQ